MADRQGVGIDFCPQCRGVWLDRGELDKIIEPSASQMRVGDDDYDGDDYRRSSVPPQGYNQGYDQGYDSPRSQYPQKRKRSFLGDLFDVFD
jgi:hypothetical protein